MEGIMESKAREAFNDMVQQCLSNVDGQLLLEMAKQKLLNDLKRSKFNTMRAEEIFQTAIEKAIYKKLDKIGAVTVNIIRGEGVIEKLAQDFTIDFKNYTGASDQRPVRREIIAEIIGK